MIAIRHNNGTVHLQDGHVTLTISNIKQISEMIEKIKDCRYDTDEEGFKRRMHILDLLHSARLQLIRHEENKCLED